MVQVLDRVNPVPNTAVGLLDPLPCTGPCFGLDVYAGDETQVELLPLHSLRTPSWRELGGKRFLLLLQFHWTGILGCCVAQDFTVNTVWGAKTNKTVPAGKENLSNHRLLSTSPFEQWPHPRNECPASVWVTAVSCDFSRLILDIPSSKSHFPFPRAKINLNFNSCSWLFLRLGLCFKSKGLRIHCPLLIRSSSYPITSGTGIIPGAGNITQLRGISSYPQRILYFLFLNYLL